MILSAEIYPRKGVAARGSVAEVGLVVGVPWTGVSGMA